ncbi:SDR family oxidoreductase [Pseudomonas lutea]|jgi:nucleoside-diphosphate-sugar epimerase|uniref:SDR family oxidoreductase n=1 Tax=Pseudomonas lutea TaxID=243924 RepID=A0ABR9AA80_9PSED|nr:SDR family oxidoreductase [Pseudomonas lutea]MBD8123027.1 SDR family oxidoreductase [Pseudomonas lutea]
MRVFITGSTGFVGSHVTRELLDAGHQVLGLVRSDAGARALLAMGAEPHQGNIEDINSLQRGAEACDAVIHTAFDHDFAKFVANCQKDARVIKTLGSVLENSNRPLIITSATPMGSELPGQAADEDRFNPEHPNPRAASELAGNALLQRGINVVVVRLSQIHNPKKQGLVTELIKQAQINGVSAYIGEGINHWSAANAVDTAHLYRLALEKHQPGARYHATAEPGIAFRLIAETIGEGLGVPTVSIPAAETEANFGWLSGFAGKDMSSMSDKTRTRLGWTPRGPGLLADLKSFFNQ